MPALRPAASPHAPAGARATHEPDLALLARAAADGDAGAWQQLVVCVHTELRASVRRYRLSPADAEDVVQTTWLRALVGIRGLNDPGAVVPWLKTIARREAFRALQRDPFEVLTGEDPGGEVAGEPSPEEVTLDVERRATVRDAVRRLPGRQRALLASMLDHPSSTYEEIAALLEMPIGSIGPTRERALVRLRCDSRLEAVSAS